MRASLGKSELPGGLQSPRARSSLLNSISLASWQCLAPVLHSSVSKLSDHGGLSRFDLHYSPKSSAPITAPMVSKKQSSHVVTIKIHIKAKSGPKYLYFLGFHFGHRLASNSEESVRLWGQRITSEI